MNKISFILIVLLCVFTLSAIQYDRIINYEFKNTEALRDTASVFFDDFGNGLNNWTALDATDPGSFWSTSPFQAYGNSGKSWRMADENISPDGGYLDDWYQVLDTPVIQLPNTNNLTLTFYQKRAIEELGGTGNFDGWDGFNVRIRLSGSDYTDAEILTECTPEYNSESLYSFGSQHGEDPDGTPGIPGWGASIDWTLTTIEIPETYTGEEVIISFAFASDPNTCTETNPEFTGVFIDEINVADVFTNDGENETGFETYTNTPVGANLWHIYYDGMGFPVLGCFDEDTNFYNPNMENYVTSSNIQLPQSTDQLIFDMLIRTEFDDVNFPECDFFSIEIHHYLGAGIWSDWHSISNPLGDPALENVVFTGSIDSWTRFSQGWSGYNDLSVLAGELIKLRIGFHSNIENSDFSGVRINFVQISNINFEGQPPENFNSELLNDFSVKLSWNDLQNPDIQSYNIYRLSQGEYEFYDSTIDTIFIDLSPIFGEMNSYKVSIQYLNGESELSNSVTMFVPAATAQILANDDGSSESGYELDPLNLFAVQFDSNENTFLTHCRFYLEEMNIGAITFYVWNDLTSSPNTVISTFTIPNDTLESGWNIVEISTAISLSDQIFYIGIQNFVNTPVFGFDENSYGASYSNEDDWQILVDGNIMLQAIVDASYTDVNESIIDNSIIQISNFPNPFNPTTTIFFDLPTSQMISLNIYNIKGQLVKNLYSGFIDSGKKSFAWNGVDDYNIKVSSGLYLYRLKTKTKNINGKMLLLK